MAKFCRYKKKAGAQVIAIQLSLDTEGFTYQKWGATQTCKSGDWVVYNNGETYTIDAETFSTTYKQVSPGVYAKTCFVWAEPATTSGAIKTKEGETHYKPGDYLVYNDVDKKDGYAVDAKTFNSLYELIE